MILHYSSEEAIYMSNDLYMSALVLQYLLQYHFQTRFRVSHLLPRQFNHEEWGYAVKRRAATSTLRDYYF